MKHKLILTFMFVVSACTYQVQVITPEPSLSDSPTAQPATLPPVETPISTSLPPPTALSVLPTFTSTALPQVGGVYPIKFNPNGTYVDVTDSILAGASKTYSISASKGQIMSISIHQGSEGDWVYIPMQVTGADGTVLCPPIENTECTFWRSALPATQNYFVKITPTYDAMNFTMRVAINPPDVATQSFQYTSTKQKATFSYTDDFAPVRFPGPQVYKVEPEIALELVDSQFYVNTNLIEAYLLFGSTNESSTVESCTQPVSFGGEENVVGEVNINGNKFVRSEGAGVGAGNTYEQIYHRMALNGYCYEVTFFFHYANIGNYSPDAGIKEFDRTALLQRFESVLSTLVIK
jgi:hypothetical protein